MDIEVISNHKMLFGEKYGFKIGRELHKETIGETL